ncbi:MAG: hypothetical protein L6408_09270 [Nanoarchaeota archaeon]|nr:hypothetical protein [Nanoarchaeota archaeon]
MPLILMGILIIAAIVGVTIWGNKEETPKEQEPEKKNLPKFFRLPTFVTLGIGILGALFFPGIALKGAVLFLAAVCLCVLNWEWFFFDPKEVEKARLKNEIQEKIAKSPINRLKRQVDDGFDELTTYIQVIHDVASELLKDYEDPVIRGILEPYKESYLDRYIGASASLARKYRRAKQGLTTINEHQLQDEIHILEGRVGKGETDLKKTLKEKKDTLENIQSIKAKQESTIKSLMEIQATMQSLQMSLLSADGSRNNQDVMDEVQKTVSSLSSALDSTFNELKKDKLFQKDEEELETTN